MSVRVTRPSGLSEGDLTAWRGALDCAEGPTSPFLRPEYALAAEPVRPVRVAVLESGHDTVGFLAYELRSLGIGGPVGGRLCDVSGPVARCDVEWEPREVARACGLRVLSLPRVPTSCHDLAPFARRAARSPYMDLSNGYEAYRSARKEAGSGLFTQLDRKTRKLAREVGPVRFEFHTDDAVVFERLLAWKSAQRRATGTPDVLRQPWTRDMLERIRGTRSAGFAGVCSCLYAGEELVAAHFGMRAGALLHYWIPAYNRDFGAYSPGLLLLSELASAAAAQGIERIDLGPGGERYKLRAGSGFVDLFHAAVPAGALPGVLADAWFGATGWVRQTPLAAALSRGLRRVRRLSHGNGVAAEPRRDGDAG